MTTYMLQEKTGPTMKPYLVVHSGIFINCDDAPFVDQILQGAKLYETRTRDTLAPCVNCWIDLIETHHDKAPIIRGRAFIERSQRVEYDDIQARIDAKILGTPYDIKPGCSKIFYKITDAQAYPLPVQLPRERENHGRSWTRYVIGVMEYPIPCPSVEPETRAIE